MPEYTQPEHDAAARRLAADMGVPDFKASGRLLRAIVEPDPDDLDEIRAQDDAMLSAFVKRAAGYTRSIGGSS